MSIQAGLLALTEYAEGIEGEFVADLTHAEREAVGAPDAWSARDLVAHVAEWRRRGTDDLQAAQRGETLADIEEFDPINRQIFEQHRQHGWDEVVEGSRQAWADLRQALTALSDADLRSTQGGRRPLWRRVTVDAANHPVLHFSEFALRHGRAERASAWVEGLTPGLVDLDPSAEWQGVVHYNLACHYAQTGRPQPALATLERAPGFRPDLKAWARQDPDLAPVRDAPGFENATLPDSAAAPTALE